MRRHLTYAAAVLLSVSACSGDDPEPRVADPTPTPSTSATPTPSAEPTKEAWEEKTDDGAVAFVEHWLEVFSVAFQTGNTEPLTRLHADECSACSGYVDLIDDAWQGSGEIRGNAWTARDLAPSQNPPEGKAAIRATIEQPAQVVRVKGQPEQRTPAGSIDYLFELTWVQNGWRISQFSVADQ